MSWQSAILHANTRKKVAMHTASTFNLSHLHSQSKSFTPSLSCQCYSLVLALYFRSWLSCLQPLYKCAHLKFTVHLQYQRICTYTRSNLPAATFSSTLESFCVDPRYVAQIPFSIIATVWSFMRTIVGVRTTVIFFITRGGNWKHKLLPEPVGCSTNVFFLANTACIILSCHSWKEVKPNCFTRIPFICISCNSTELSQWLKAQVLCGVLLLRLLLLHNWMM